MEYNLAIDLEVLRFLLSLKSVNRAKLLLWLEELKSSPFLAGQFTTFDSTQREIQVSVISSFLVYHWTDHAVRIVQVVKIEFNLA